MTGWVEKKSEPDREIGREKDREGERAGKTDRRERKGETQK